MAYNHVTAILTAVNNLVRENLVDGKNDRISHKAQGGMYITKKGVDFAKITEADVEFVKLDVNSDDEEIKLHSMLYNSNEETNAICHTHPFYCTTISEVGVKIPPVLDDMAQIVGPTAKVAASSNYKDVKKALKRRNCCLIKDDGIIATTRTLNECVTACLVLEKAGKCFIEGYSIGEPISLPIWEAALMHVVYLKKYSKTNQANKLQEEQ